MGNKINYSFEHCLSPGEQVVGIKRIALTVHGAVDYLQHMLFQDIFSPQPRLDLKPPKVAKVQKKATSGTGTGFAGKDKENT